MKKRKLSEDPVYYVYIYLDPRKPGRWEYKNWVFDFQPLYVGEGKNGRMKDHLNRSSLKVSSIKSTAILKGLDMGLQPIYFKLFVGLSEEKALDIEMEIIAHFGRINIGTGILANLTDGGIGIVNMGSRKEVTKKANKTRALNGYNKKPVLQLSMEGDLIQEWGSLLEAALGTMGYTDVSKIRDCCYLRRDSVYGYRWQFAPIPPVKPKSSKVKTVYRYSSQGDFVDKFESSAEAGRLLGFLSTSIRKCCHGELRMCYGFQWFYSDMGPKVPPYCPPRAFKKVSAYDDHGNLIKTYNSALDAENDYCNVNIWHSYSRPFMSYKMGGVYWKKGD